MTDVPFLAINTDTLDWDDNVTLFQLLTADLARTPLRQQGGSVACPSGPGLGVEVDEAAIRKFHVKQF